MPPSPLTIVPSAPSGRRYNDEPPYDLKPDPWPSLDPRVYARKLVVEYATRKQGARMYYRSRLENTRRVELQKEKAARVIESQNSKLQAEKRKRKATRHGAEHPIPASSAEL